MTALLKRKLAHGWSDLGVSVSLSNLLFFKPWSDLGHLSSSAANLSWPFESASTTWASYFGLVLDMVLVSFLIFACLRWARHSHKVWWWGIVNLILGCSLFFSINGMRLALGLGPISSRVGLTNIALVGGSLLFWIAVCIWKLRAKSVEVFHGILLLFLPFSAVTLVQGGVGTFKHVGIRQPKPATEHQAAGYRARVVWFLFDALDYRVAFEKRPAGMTLPALDVLRNESFSATNAYSPGMRTAYSIPSYFAGRPLEGALRVTASADMEVTFKGDGQATLWNVKDTLFHQLNERGLRSGVVGWYLPYCRWLEGDVSHCTRFSHYNFFKYPYSDSVPVSMLNSLKEISLVRPNHAFFHQVTYEMTLKESKKVAIDPSLDVVFVHWPIPHVPWIYDAATHQFTTRNTKGHEGYFDNLVLTDLTLGQVRAHMEQKGMWDNTTFILTSDHGWHESSEYDGVAEDRIPFLVKFPGQKNGARFTEAFNAILLKDLILSISRGEITDVETLVDWLNLNRGRNPVLPQAG